MVPSSEAEIPEKVMLFAGTASKPFSSSSPLGLSPAGLEHLPADFQETRNVKQNQSMSSTDDPLAKAGGMMLVLCGHLSSTRLQKAFLGPETSQPQRER